MRISSVGRVLVAAGLLTAFAGVAPGHAATFSGTDGLIAYSQFMSKGTQILTADPKSNKITDISKKKYGDDEPDFSPSGKLLLFRNNGSIWTMTSTGGSRTDLTPGQHSSYGDPAWSPDGSKIVFSDNGEIAVMDANGSHITVLTDDGNNQTPDWSPDGTQIAFVSYDDPGDVPHLFVMNPDGSHLTDISAVTDPQDQYADQDPSWSPDSTHLLVDSSRPAAPCCTEIFEISRTGSSATLVSQDDGDLGPVFSPDGTEFAYTTDYDEAGALQVVVEPLSSDTGGGPVSDGADTSVGNDASWQAVVHPVLKAKPTSGKAGTSVGLTLSGFSDGEVVSLSFLDGDSTTPLGTVTADSHGNASTSVTLPAGAAAGKAKIAGTGATSGRSASATFTVKAG